MSAVARVMLARGCRCPGRTPRSQPSSCPARRRVPRCTSGHDQAFVDGVETVVMSSAIPGTTPSSPQRGRRDCSSCTAPGAGQHSRPGAPRRRRRGERQDHDDLDAHGGPAAGGRRPVVASGASWPSTAPTRTAGTGTAFVAEADESDGSFLVYRPEVAVVTNVQPDHLDFYGTFERVQAAYSAFAGHRAGWPPGRLPRRQGSRALAAAARAGTRVLTYGWSPDADVVLRDEVSAGSTWAGSTVTGPDGRDRALRINIPGRHNLLNAAAAYTVAVAAWARTRCASSTGCSASPAPGAGSSSRDGRRRHASSTTTPTTPARCAAVVSTAAELVGDRAASSWSSSRTSTRGPGTSPHEFAAALAPADVVVLMEIYAAREDPCPGCPRPLVADALLELRPDADVTVIPSWSAVADTWPASLARATSSSPWVPGT